jgi:hypothetical protein
MVTTAGSCRHWFSGAALAAPLPYHYHIRGGGRRTINWGATSARRLPHGLERRRIGKSGIRIRGRLDEGRPLDHVFGGSYGVDAGGGQARRCRDAREVHPNLVGWLWRHLLEEAETIVASHFCKQNMRRPHWYRPITPASSG